MTQQEGSAMARSEFLFGSLEGRGSDLKINCLGKRMLHTCCGELATDPFPTSMFASPLLGILPMRNESHIAILSISE